MDDIGKQVVRHWHWFCVARSETQDVNESAIAMTLTRGLLMPVLMADSQRELALNEKWFNGCRGSGSVDVRHTTDHCLSYTFVLM